MDGDSWSRFSAASKRHQSTLHNRFDLCLGFEDGEGGEDDLRAEFACPFCDDDFDIVGLCCHVEEEHPVEAKNGVCPICAARVGMDMIGHIMAQHGNFFKTQRRRRFRRGSSGSQSTLSLLRKELREGNIQSLFGASSYTIASSNTEPDPLLSSFINNLPVSDPSREDEPETLDVGNVIKAAEENAVESTQPVLSDKDQEEKARRSEFVRGLVMSTIFDEIS